MYSVKFDVDLVWLDDDGSPVSSEALLAMIPSNPAWAEDDEEEDGSYAGRR